jgi:hypothetical protein
MPQFQIDLGNEAQTFSELPEFTRGYIEAMFFTNSGEREDELHEATFADFAPETLEQIVKDCEAFQATLPKDGHGRTALDLAYDYATVEYEPEQAGRDFWFSRCGHGVGFWDRDLGQVGDDLHTHANTFGNVDPYMGDDGRIYLT